LVRWKEKKRNNKTLSPLVSAVKNTLKRKKTGCLICKTQNDPTETQARQISKTKERTGGKCKFGTVSPLKTPKKPKNGAVGKDVKGGRSGKTVRKKQKI